MQIILDGRRSNASQIVSGYLGQIIATLAEELIGERQSASSVTIVPRYWFNPNLTFIWFTVPSLVAIIALLIGLVVTALSIARERELGTFDQLLVSPLRTHEILIGKLTPPMMIGLFHITIYVLAAIFIFGIPLRMFVRPSLARKLFGSTTTLFAPVRRCVDRQVLSTTRPSVPSLSRIQSPMT